MHVAEGLKQWLWRHGPVWGVVAALAWTSIATVLGRTDGAPSVPLDDAYIHFQFARGFSQFTPFVYSPGTPPVAGATSLLWPAVLAPAFWFGLGGEGIIWWAWVLGFVSLGLLAQDTRALAERLLSPLVALAAGLTVLCFGGLAWLAGSGMEAVPFAWLWVRTLRRIADWAEAGHPTLDESRLPAELSALALLTPLMRPEGSIAALCAALALGVRGRGRTRALAIVAAVAAVLPNLLFWLGSGSFSTTTAAVKWLPKNPYLNVGEVAAQVAHNLRLLFGTLFNGELWSASVVPSGGALFAACALPALCLQSYRTRLWWRGAAVLVAALGIFIPATYDTFLWNRLRYLWPFAPAWFVALGALCEVCGSLIARFRPNYAEIRGLFAGALAGAFVTKLPLAIDDLADSSLAIRAQQASLGKWAAVHLPASARIGINDTGAISYFSGRSTFDVVGLTTPGESKYWVAGVGSRFEHYEELDESQRPTHFIVYPEWFGLDGLLGPELTRRTVHATILGGTTMVACEANYRTLDTGARPTLVPGDSEPIDVLDVADLASEAAHGYELFDATQADNAVFGWNGALDGGRAGRARDHFGLELEPGGLLVLRVSSEGVSELTVHIAGKPAGAVVSDGAWSELRLRVPAWVPRGVSTIDIAARDQTVATLHYWSYPASTPNAL